MASSFFYSSLSRAVALCSDLRFTEKTDSTDDYPRQLATRPAGSGGGASEEEESGALPHFP